MSKKSKEKKRIRALRQMEEGLSIERKHFRWFYLGSIFLCVGIVVLLLVLDLSVGSSSPIVQTIKEVLIGGASQHTDIVSHIHPSLLCELTIIACLWLETKTARDSYTVNLLKDSQEKGDSAKELGEAIESSTKMRLRQERKSKKAE